jgi:cytochrome P450
MFGLSPKGGLAMVTYERRAEVDVDRFVECFDHHDPSFAREGVPHAVYDQLRARCPIAHTDAHGGFWVLSRYADVATVARNDALFQSRHGFTIDPVREEGPTGAPGDYGARPKPLPIELDPPEFFEYRKVLNPLFAPRRMARREADVREITNSVIDEFIGRGHCDLFDDLCAPLPAMVTLRFLGLPEDEWRKWASPVHEDIHSDRAGEARPPVGVDLATMMAVAAQRRAAPRDDWLSALTHATVEDGRLLRDDEVLSMAYVLLAAGVDTTTNALGSALVYLSRNPQARQRLIDQPDILATAIEEMLRVFAPVQGFSRTAAEDTEIDGHAVKAGERVLMLWASANMDEAEFPDAAQVKLDRLPNRHFTFGVGIHRCVGASLARLEMRVVLEEVLRRLPDFEVDEGGLVLQPAVHTIYGFSRIPASFTPASL